MVNPIFEDKVVALLSSHIKAQKWSCKMVGDPNLLKAKLPSVTVTGDNVIYNNAVIEKLVLNFKNVTVNVKDKSIKSCEEATADIKIKDSELTKLIRNYVKNISDSEAEAHDGKITLKGNMEFLKQTVHLEVTGNVRFENGTDLILEPDSFRVMKLGIPIPNIAKNFINEKINPVYRITENPYSIYVDDLEYSEGYVKCRGRFDTVKVMALFTQKK